MIFKKCKSDHDRPFLLKIHQQLPITSSFPWFTPLPLTGPCPPLWLCLQPLNSFGLPHSTHRSHQAISSLKVLNSQLFLSYIVKCRGLISNATFSDKTFLTT
jgi:hypothetical protein